MSLEYRYFQSTNDSPRDGTIHEIGLRQLRRFENAADMWPVRFELRDNRSMKVCRECGQCLWFIRDENKQEFKYTDAETKALIVAHIRQRHADDIDENGDIIEDSGEYKILDLPSGPHTSGVGGGNAYRPEYQSIDSRGIEFT